MAEIVGGPVAAPRFLSMKEMKIKIVRLKNIKKKFKTVSERRCPEGNFSCALCR